MPLPTTPLLGHDQGEGWHLAPRRRYLFAAGNVLAGVVLVYLGWTALRQGVVAAAVVAWALAVPVAAVPFERRRALPARTVESPTHFGLLLPVHPLKVSLIAILAGFGALLLAVPFGLVWAGTQGRLHGGDYVMAVVISLVAVVLGLVFLAGVSGGVASHRGRNRGVLITVDGVVLRTQRPPASFPWHAVRGVRPHWRRQREPGDFIRSVEDSIHNWLTFVVDPGTVTGPATLPVFTGTNDPTVDASAFAIEPELVLAVCRFYLENAEERAELRTTACLDRVASLARGVGAL